MLPTIGPSTPCYNNSSCRRQTSLPALSINKSRSLELSPSAMPPFEFDKPSKAPIQAQDYEDDGIRIQNVDRNGRHGALFQDPQGSVIFPSYVPPNVESPVLLRAPASAKDPGSPQGLRETQSESPKKVASKQKRPFFEKKYLTDAPHRADNLSSAFPSARAIKRAGTNTSILSRSRWNARGNDDADNISISSASDDDEDRDKGWRPRMNEDSYRRFRVANDNYHTKGRVSKRDGRLAITVNDTSNTGYLAKALGAATKHVVAGRGGQGKTSQRPMPSRLSSATTTTCKEPRRPKLNIVIMVIGSRGDAQPFLQIGKMLKEEYGHRVRIATHPAFRDFVEKDSGLEFFSVGGDPSELMAFMVKNPGMIPNLETVKAGDIGRRRAAMAEMFEGFWRACINATDNEKDIHNLKMMGSKDPFIADAIIANPPSFAHIHCAEALGIPLHLMFTFPYTPTQAFPHPLATIKRSNVDPGYTNFISYPLVEMVIWQGLGDLVNHFRVKTLGLDPVSTLWAPGSTYRLHVPFTYLWSPGLVSKPEDWGPEIDISGFVFLDLASSFEPPQDLVEFLDAGEMPIYIGFGSIVVDDANNFTEMIFEAVQLAGVRALVSKGWGGLGQDNVPENIFMLENIPHDWLFPKVRACIIHGGAGTTAIALKCGKPTMVVPFFGDQHFWGPMVANAGAGPEPVPYKELSAESLAQGIKYCLTDKAVDAAQGIARNIELEGDGARNAVRSFHSNLMLSGEHSMRCSILNDRVAVWSVQNTSLKLSALAAEIAIEKGFISWRKLRLIRHKEWNDFEGPGEPLTGVAGSLMGTVGDIFSGIGSVPYRLAKTSNKRSESKKKKNERMQQRQRTRAQSSTEFPFPRQGEGTRSQQSASNRASITTTTTPGTAPLEPAQVEYMNDIHEGVKRSGRAIFRAPVDLSLAVAQGFHNAPRLYGDDTVRRPIRVTGIKSGFRAARAEFVYGIYDGVTGLVRLPVRGAKEDGVKGAIIGFGKGLTGFVLKDIAALVGPIGYTLKGISKQFSRGKQPIKYLRRARIIQAQRELSGIPEDERKSVAEDVAKGWAVMRRLAHVIMEEHRKRSFLSQLGCGNKRRMSLGKWGKGRAFESVEIAEMAIEAIKQGEDVDVMVGKNRENTKEARKSIEQRVSQEISRKTMQRSRASRDTRQVDSIEDSNLRGKENYLTVPTEAPSMDTQSTAAQSSEPLLQPSGNA
ncbi:hypothetical protein F5X99DRAFT_398827 [Biscogniauxia marginata]|nr:hypothetical protein F5X99DRAFT_398827 [Biscogniauxia marginata]